MKCDVAIIGGGPSGSTVGCLLRKYRPDLEVVILEQESFPRDHVGESQLPVISRVLNEMGVWDKVEAADFPIKVGATLKWGLTTDKEYYQFHFIPDGKLADQPRPASYQGQRVDTAFQVDRGVYDKILLDHAREMGCQVFEQTKVAKILHTGDTVSSLAIQRGEEQDTIEARYYVDASGGNSIMRKTMGVDVESPTLLRNIAIWDYWQNAEWAESIGTGGTWIQIMSFGWGWLWFIPISTTRTSLGLITSAEYFKKSGKSTDEIYLEAISIEPRIRELVKNATRENVLQATKDWSYIADRIYGDNWFLTGDACGFADPILSAGMSLAHMSGRRVAYSILEMESGESDPAWVKEEYQRVQRKNISNHIRFADYWYSVNAKFTDLTEYCSEIAKGAGLTLDADAAFRWLGTGGFADEISGLPFAGTYRLSAIKQFTGRFGGKEGTWSFAKNNVFELDTEGASEETVGIYEKGRVLQVPCLVRDGKTLPIHLLYGLVYKALKKEKEIQFLCERFIYEAERAKVEFNETMAHFCLETLEALVIEGWVKASFDPKVAMLDFGMPEAMR